MRTMRTTIGHELDTLSPEYSSLEDLSSWVQSLRDLIGTEITIYEDGVAISAKNRPTFLMTRDIMEAGKITHRHHPYTNSDDRGYYAFMVERPMTEGELEKERIAEAKRVAQQAEWDRREFEELKRKGFK